MLHAVMAALMGVLVLGQQPSGTVTSTDLPKPGTTVTTPAKPAQAAPKAPIVQVPSKVVQAPAPKSSQQAPETEPVPAEEEKSYPQPEIAAPVEQPAPTPAAPPVVQQPARSRSLREEPRPPSTKPVAAFWMILPEQRS